MEPSTAATIRSIVPQFTVPDVVAAAEYYRDVWGFNVSGYWMDPPVFAIVERDGVEIYFNKATPETPPRTGRVPGGYDAYLHVRGLDAWASSLRERGADIIDGPELRVYGQREMVVRDLNGLIIALGEEAPFRRVAERKGRDRTAITTDSEQ
ncbi:MAG TPA: VOC family protein [Gemmatimonadaceae bacterium]